MFIDNLGDSDTILNKVNWEQTAANVDHQQKYENEGIIHSLYQLIAQIQTQK